MVLVVTTMTAAMTVKSTATKTVATMVRKMDEERGMEREGEDKETKVTAMVVMTVATMTVMMRMVPAQALAFAVAKATTQVDIVGEAMVRRRGDGDDVGAAKVTTVASVVVAMATMSRVVVEMIMVVVADGAIVGY